MDFPVSTTRSAPFPWRTAALVAVGVAAAELVLLLFAGGVLLTATDAPVTAKRAAAQVTAPVAKPAVSKAAAAAGLTRRQVEVVILNGNGRTGAAAAASARVQGRGYRVGLVGNAPSHSYPRSLVMYRPGFAAEGKRLARDLGIALVSPLDGMRPGQLRGAHAVLILGG